MNAFILIKLIASVEYVDARKRLQKAIFLLETSGCKLVDDFRIHFYGPYSWDLAETVDLLTQQGFVEEEVQNNGAWGKQYSYKITAKGEEYLIANQGETDAPLKDSNVAKFKRLADKDLWELELAATISFFQSRKEMTWDQAKDKTAAFKQVRPGAGILDDAEKLAREFAESPK